MVALYSHTWCLPNTHAFTRYLGKINSYSYLGILKSAFAMPNSSFNGDVQSQSATRVLFAVAAYRITRSHKQPVITRVSNTSCSNFLQVIHD